MMLVKQKGGRLAFVEKLRSGEKEISDPAEIDAAVQKDFDIRQAKEAAASLEELRKIDDSDQIAGDDGPITGYAPLGGIAPRLARSSRWQSASEAKAIEAMRKAFAAGGGNSGSGEGQQGGGSDAGGGDAGGGDAGAGR